MPPTTDDVLGIWESTCHDAIRRDLAGAVVHVAIYDEDGWEGSAYTLYERDGVLYENYDSHCSCYGFENWTPDATTRDAVRAGLARYRHDPEIRVAVLAWLNEEVGSGADD